MIEEARAPLQEDVCIRLTTAIEAALIERFKGLKPLGNVYIDPSLVDVNVPFALASSTKAAKTVGRGSRISLGEGNVIRFFMWWRNMSSLSPTIRKWMREMSCMKIVLILI